MTISRARRALLFCPGTERKKIEKAAAIDVDAVIVDLEDAAALSRKAEARAITIAALAECDFGTSERIVRINPVGSGLENDDVAALIDAPHPPDGVMVPKVESAHHIVWVADRLAEIERRHGFDEGRLVILALIETALGVVRLNEIAASHDRLVALVFGAEDLCGDIGATRTPDGHEVAYAKAALVIHAAAFGRQAIDTPFVDLMDIERLAQDTTRSLQMGYTGRLAIHPRQIEPIFRVFTPSEEDYRQAERLIREHERHQAEGRGVFEFDGRMVDMPMVRAAERVLARGRGARKNG